MISVKVKGDFRKVDSFFERLKEFIHMGGLDKYGQMGVDALSNATPVDTGRAASSWKYEIERGSGNTRIVWHNDDIEGGYNVAILLQYGHGTRNGGYVQGIDYINPAMEPVFEKIADTAWKEISSL